MTDAPERDDNDDLPEHPFAPYVRTIGRGKRARRDFSRAEADASMSAILAGNATATQIGAWLMLLRVKEETPEELAGFVDACRRWISAHQPALPHADIDWPSYAGKKKHHPWYLLAALLLAQHGHRIFMHGGPAHTPARLYSDQVLTALGIAVASSVEQAALQLDQSGFCYLGLDILCPPLAELLRLRYELGLRSPINTLSRCLNPVAAPTSLQSVFHPAYITLQRGAAQLLDEPQLALFKGEGGEIEIRPDAQTEVFALANGQPHSWTLAAAMPRQTPPGTPDASALRRLWRDDEDEYGRQAVIRTAAVVLVTAGICADQTAALAQAERYWQQRQRDRF